MSEEDHRVRRHHSEDEIVDETPEQQQALLGKFAWANDLEEESDEDKPSVQYAENDVSDCCLKIAQHVLSNITVDHFHGIQNTGGMYFEIPLDSDFHLLLHERFNGTWDLDSRLEMVDKIRAELDAFFEDEAHSSELNRKIREMIPDSRKTCSADKIYLNDDTVILEDNGFPFSVEISLRFEANLEGI